MDNIIATRKNSLMNLLFDSKKPNASHTGKRKMVAFVSGGQGAATYSVNMKQRIMNDISYLAGHI